MLQIDFPLGATFSVADDVDGQTLIVRDLLDFALHGGAEELRRIDYSRQQQTDRPVSSD